MLSSLLAFFQTTPPIDMEHYRLGSAEAKTVFMFLDDLTVLVVRSWRLLCSSHGQKDCLQ